jgi:hypothetical protein
MCYFLSRWKESHIITPVHRISKKTTRYGLEIPANAKYPARTNSPKKPMKNAKSALPVLKNIYCFSIYLTSIPSIQKFSNIFRYYVALYY